MEFTFGDLLAAADDFEAAQGDGSRKLPVGSYPMVATEVTGKISSSGEWMIIAVQGRVTSGEHSGVGAVGTFMIPLSPEKADQIARVRKDLKQFGVDIASYKGELEDIAQAIARELDGITFSGAIKRNGPSKFNRDKGVLNEVYINAPRSSAESTESPSADIPF